MLARRLGRCMKKKVIKIKNMGNNLARKFSTVALSIATVATLSGFGTFVPVAQGATVDELQAQIAQLLAQITSLQSQLSTAGGSSSSSSAVPASLLTSGNLTIGSKGAAVMDLQKFLNANGYKVAASGAGSPGMETSTFGSLTQAALAKWQAAVGISPAAGYFGPITRAKLSSLGSTGSTGGSTGGTVTPAGSGLTVTLDPMQPAAALAPASATRIPFTKVRLTASSDGDVVVNSLIVERTSLAEDASLAGITLIDENGLQLGLEKTLNSNHQATIGEAVTIKAGQTRTLLVTARRAAAGTRGGQTVALSVVGVNTSAKVNASFPLTGATHTVNETLTVGSLTNPVAGPLDPGSSQTKEIGNTGYIFSSVKVTAGSAERVLLKSIRWNQTGSAGATDLSNIKTVVDGTDYAVVVSADGKYFTSVFPGNGLLIDKGFSKELSIKGDITGGSSRTVDFDIDRRADIYAVGETFGYGILPANGTDSSGTDDGAFHQDTNPWYDAYEVLVSTGTISVSKLNSVTAQNIAINLANQPLGGWAVDVKGEPISISQMIFTLSALESSGTSVGINDITNVALFDESGKNLAGPIDPTATTVTGNVTFTDTVTFPVGVTNVILKGKLGTDFDNNDTVVASTTPSSQWTTVTGQVTGKTITPSPTSGVAGNTMTVKAATLAISVSTAPIAQTVIAGVTQFEFARYILDAAASGEDIRLTSLPIEYNVGGGTATDLTNCKLYDGANAITTGSNVKNPTAAASSTSFTFDGTGLILAKGASKQLSLKCDLKAGATGAYSWGYDSSSTPSPTGVTSGQSVSAANLTENDSAGQIMTAASGGSLAISLDTASPAYTIVSPGQTVELARLRYAAANENVEVRRVALQLTGGASNTPIDLVGQAVTLWDGATQVGDATFSSSDYATSSAITNFVVPKDGAKILTIKGTIAGISNSGPLTRSGDLLVVDYDGDNEGSANGGNYGVGQSSGSNVTPATTDTASNGVRIMKAYPTFSKLSMKSGETTLVAGDAKALYRFSVTANNGDLAIYKTSFSVSSSTANSSATTSKFSLYVYKDANDSQLDPNFSSGGNASGLVNSGNCYSGLGSSSATPPATGNLGAGSALVEIYPDTNSTGCNRGTTTLIVPAGETRWFKLAASIGTLSGSGTSENIQSQLEGDSAFPVNAATLMQVASGVDGDTNDDFIWAPISTTTANTKNDLDFTNGYGVNGLPPTNMTLETISK